MSQITNFTNSAKTKIKNKGAENMDNNCNNSNYNNSDLINHPKHYQSDFGRECIEEMMLIFGKKAVFDFCRLNAYKYKYRAGKKVGNSKEQDLLKADWYLDYAEKLKDENYFD